jgi:hypothetical protein
MADEAELVVGTYAVLIPSEQESDGNFCSISDPLDDDLTDGSEDYPLLDFKLDVTAGTPTENGVIDLYRVPFDDTDQSPTPAGSYLQQYVGSFVLDNAADEYYLLGVPNIHKSDKFIWQNNDGSATLTCTLSVRGRSIKPGA